MHTDALFIVLTLVVIIIVIMLAKDLVTAVLIVSLLAHFLVISGRFKKLSGSFLDIDVADADGIDLTAGGSVLSTAPTGAAEPDNEPQSDVATEPYGPFYENWNAYGRSYLTAYDEPAPIAIVSAAERNYDTDAANALMARRRTRDKRAMDGAVTKDVDYYRYHYGGELAQAEAKPWWGRGEV